MCQYHSAKSFVVLSRARHVDWKHYVVCASCVSFLLGLLLTLNQTQALRRRFSSSPLPFLLYFLTSYS
ncbi:unnamed protein product [Coffea canephora]|uniref:Uncharacterized protein n=1 Tax=Coffea canephora TaxID=49390 RepID=A0A068V520_COFCA|nr:unnamed protein product [Coffea canephora]